MADVIVRTLTYKPTGDEITPSPTSEGSLLASVPDVMAGHKVVLTDADGKLYDTYLPPHLAAAAVGDLADLTTTDKTSLVAAINEAATTGSGTGGGGATINDTAPSTTTVYSSSKTEALVSGAQLVAMTVEEGAAGTDTTARAMRADHLAQIVNARVTGSASTSPTSIGRTMLTAADAGEVRTVIGAVADTDPRLSDARTPIAHTHPVSEISDSTATGQAVLTAASATAARTAIGAKADSYVPTWTEITSKPTTFPPSTHNHVATDISDSTTTGRSLLKTSSADSARTTIGAEEADNPTTSYLWHDVAAFGRKWAYPSYEITTDGTTWTDDNANRDTYDPLLTGKEGLSVYVVPSGGPAIGWRATWSSGVGWSNVERWIIGFAYTGTTQTKDIIIESSADGGVTWTERYRKDGDTSNSRPLGFKSDSFSGDSRLRLTLLTDGTNAVRLSGIRALTKRWGDQGGGYEFTVPYDWDAQRTLILESLRVKAGVNDATTPAPGSVLIAVNSSGDVVFRGSGSTATPNDFVRYDGAGRFTVLDPTADGHPTPRSYVTTALADKVDVTDPRLSDARTPTAHTHVVADVTGLQAVLDGKADDGHTHDWASITSKPTTFTPAAHVHELSDLNVAGTPSSTTYLRGDGTWATPAGTGGTQGGDITSTQITDSTIVGRAVLTAADAATARTAIGAGTSNLALGTTSTTAKAGDWTPDWAEVANKPATFTPSAHTHPAVDISDATATGRSVLTAANAAAARTAIGAGTSNLAVGSTAGTAKAGDWFPTWTEITSKPTTFTPSAHTHLWAEITDKPTSFTPAAHTHAVADVTGLQAALDGKAPTSHTHVIADVTGLQTALDGKSAVGHTHLWAEITDKPATFTPSTHNHVWADITDPPATYVPSAHTHLVADVTGLQAALDAKADEGLDYIATYETGDFNTLDLSKPGVYRVRGGTGFVTNMPNTTAQWWHVVVFYAQSAADANTTMMLATSSISNTAYYKAKYGSTWGSWVSWANLVAMSVAEGTAGTVTSSRAVRADYLKQIINFFITGSTATSATATGQAVATAADAAAARTAIGAGTSNLALGTTSTTAKAGDYVPAWTEVIGKPTTFPPSDHVHAVADVTGLQAALDGKAAATHTHLWADITDKPATFAPSAHTHTASQISDSTAVGRSVLTAADAATARTAIGAGTSNLAIGTTGTTAKAGDYVPAWTEITSKPATFPPSTHSHVVGDITATGTPSATTFLRGDGQWATPAAGGGDITASQITDSTAVGRSVLTAVDAAAARTAIGAGTSSLTIGTTAGTAKAGDYAPTWTEITSKPATFPPSAHTHIWAEITDKPATFAPSAHTHPAADISDASTVGRNVLTATDAATARTAIGAGTSNLALGTTASTAKAGNYVPAWTEVTGKPTTFTPAAHTHPASEISDVTTVGRSVLTAADAAAARTAIGAGTSSLTLGTTAGTAKAGDYTPTWTEITSKPATFQPSAHTHLWADITDKPTTFAPGAHTHPSTDISDSTATGRSLITATDAAAARTAIGAGTSNLALGTTGTTAAAGNHTHTAANITDTTAVGRSVMTAGDAAAARTAIGAGTSNLTIGTTSTTAKAGDYQPASTNISDSTATGRALITATDAAAARTTLAAVQNVSGVSGVWLGTTANLPGTGTTGVLYFTTD